MERAEFELKLTNEISTLKIHARHFTPNVDDSNDLIQETILKALKFWNSFKEGTNFKAWLYTIMRNTFINHYRLKSSTMLLIQTADDLISEQIPAEPVKNLAESNMQMDEIKTAIDKLSINLSKPFEMYFTGYKYHEIADMLSLPIGTIKTRIHTARKSLRKTLKPFHYQATA